jgi:hypothetical protein
MLTALHFEPQDRSYSSEGVLEHLTFFRLARNYLHITVCLFRQLRKVVNYVLLVGNS